MNQKYANPAGREGESDIPQRDDEDPRETAMDDDEEFEDAEDEDDEASDEDEDDEEA